MDETTMLSQTFGDFLQDFERFVLSINDTVDDGACDDWVYVVKSEAQPNLMNMPTYGPSGNNIELVNVPISD